LPQAAAAAAAVAKEPPRMPVPGAAAALAHVSLSRVELADGQCFQQRVPIATAIVMATTMKMKMLLLRPVRAEHGSAPEGHRRTESKPSEPFSNRAAAAAAAAAN
jgi:hypothetical protein